ncbi:MAG: hypothetical protein IJ466_04005 [Clostridia bacterium]|nr:hypothetical protein [Clostridia bacterium]
MRKYWIFILSALFVVAVVSAGWYAARPKSAVVQVEAAEDMDEMEFTVVLNEYAPAKWNHGYGHYDLTIAARQGETFICKLGSSRVECGEITLSYGPLNGDDSPARVHLYTGQRTDHAPQERLVVYEGLDFADFNAFMRWFMGKFARYEGNDGEYHVFHVRDKEFGLYSIAVGNHCISATMRMIDALPGAADPERNGRAAMVDRLEAYF